MDQFDQRLEPPAVGEIALEHAGRGHGVEDARHHPFLPHPRHDAGQWRAALAGAQNQQGCDGLDLARRSEDAACACRMVRLRALACCAVPVGGLGRSTHRKADPVETAGATSSLRSAPGAIHCRHSQAASGSLSSAGPDQARQPSLANLPRSFRYPTWSLTPCTSARSSARRPWPSYASGRPLRLPAIGG